VRVNSRADSEAANKALVRRWFEEVWNQGRADLIDQLRVPDMVAVGLSHGNSETRGNDAFKNFYFNFREAFPDLRGEIHDIVAEDDKVVARLTFKATHLGHSLGIKPTRKTIEFSCLAMARIVDGKIGEAWNCIDYLGILEQLGVVSQSAFRKEFFTTRLTPE
jgi:steroid delta-isomerase-like uncharacterized protein